MRSSGRPILFLFGLTLGSAAGVAGPPEYQVKAAYVFNFAKFVEWPKTDSLGSLGICIYGKDPFDGFLDEAVRGKLVHGLPIAVNPMSPRQQRGAGCKDAAS